MITKGNHAYRTAVCLFVIQVDTIKWQAIFLKKMGAAEVELKTDRTPSPS